MPPQSTTMADLGAATLSSQALLRAAVLMVFAYAVKLYYCRTPMPKLPVVGKHGLKMGRKELIEGFEKYPNALFIIPQSPPLVILPISLLDEVRNLPENISSFTKVVRQMFTSHTALGVRRTELIKVVNVDLNRNITSATDIFQDEIRYSVNSELGPCEDWTSFALYAKMLRIVAFLSGRVFVGKPLSRDEEWISSTINYTIDCVKAKDAVLKYPAYLREIIAPFLPEIKSVKQHLINGSRLLEPILRAQISAVEHDKSHHDETGDPQGSFISWLLKGTAPEFRQNPKTLAINQMVLSFASFHTTTTVTSHAIFDLAARPEYIKPLRDEIEQVIIEDGQDIDSEGFLRLKKQSITKLRKLDSFLKESQRLSPLGFTSHNRILTSDLTLSTGQTLPKGTRIAFPAYAVHTSPLTTTYSPEYNPPATKPPREFDGFRYSNLRAMEGKQNKHQFVTTSPESLNFGHGKHACPGRFFASYEIKVILIELLRHWEFRLKGDVDQVGGEDKRPENKEVDFQVSPNALAEIEFRRRED